MDRTNLAYRDYCKNGNAFHWQGHDRKRIVGDTIINYLLPVQSTIEDYIFFHALEGKGVAGTL